MSLLNSKSVFVNLYHCTNTHTHTENSRFDGRENMSLLLLEYSTDFEQINAMVCVTKDDLVTSLRTWEELLQFKVNG